MNWYENAVMYHIYPLGFCGAPKFNEGGEPVNRLEKVLDWIPHLKELGVDAVYFGPVFESVEHGYDTTDYRVIDRRLGTNEMFAHICDELHKNGIRVILDGVFNHVGRNFWAFRDVQEKGQASEYCDWFAGLNFGGQSPCGDNFWYEGWNGYYNLVKLNLRNWHVCDYLIDAVGMWMDEFHIDGIRFDAADCVDFDFFRRIHNFCKERNPEFWLMGEIIHGDYKRWANPEMLDSVTNYECYKGIYSSHNDKNYFEINYSINRQFGNGGIYQGTALYNFVDNHDVNRLASTLVDQRYLPLCYTLLYCMPGIPSIYYGSEYGVMGRPEPQRKPRPVPPSGQAGQNLPRLSGTAHRFLLHRRGAQPPAAVRQGAGRQNGLRGTESGGLPQRVPLRHSRSLAGGCHQRSAGTGGKRRRMDSYGTVLLDDSGGGRHRQPDRAGRRGSCRSGADPSGSRRQVS